MSAPFSGLLVLGTIATVNVVAAAWTLMRPRAIAAANKAFVESGKENWFEQRRAWKAYGTTPETDPERLKRNAWRLLIFNLGLVGCAALLEIFR